MRWLIAIFIAFGIAACGGQERVYERYNAMAYEDCVFYGFTPGTDSFAFCMMKRGASRPNAGFR